MTKNWVYEVCKYIQLISWRNWGKQVDLDGKETRWDGKRFYLLTV
jgi:hypothetical protein